MFRKGLMPIFLFFILVPSLYAKDTYDLGQVQIVGADRSEEQYSQNIQDISLEMGEKPNVVPELPDIVYPKQGPLAEKPFEPSSGKPKVAKKLSIEVGKGSSDTFFGRLSGTGSYNDYEGKFELMRDSKDGFKSQSDDRKTFLSGALKTFGENKYEMKVDGDYLTDHFGQRGTRSAPTPNAGLNDTYRRFGFKGSGTTKEGAFVSGKVNMESAARTTDQPSKAFKEDSSYYSGQVQGEYLVNLKKNLAGKLLMDIAKRSYSIDNGPNSDNTKRIFGVSGEYNFREKAFLELGLKGIGAMGANKTVPQFRFDYHWSDPWQALLIYDEDIGNCDLKEVFLPRRYVPWINMKPSHRKRWSGRLNYRWEGGNTVGAELFRETETGAIEYVDSFDAAKGLLVSGVRFAGKAKRAGLTLGGHVKLDDNFSLGAATTIQDPKDTVTGNQLSYEAKRILDVLFSYRSGAFEADYTRKAYFDRVAYIPATKVDSGDYSRADLFFKYHFKKDMRAFLKVKDLYDDAKSLRYNVPEEGRVSIVGLEADF